ncbi:hypothetical protein D3C81_2097050 [compost metagenome]
MSSLQRKKAQVWIGLVVHGLLCRCYPLSLMSKILPEGFGIGHEIGRHRHPDLFYLKNSIVCILLLLPALNEDVVAVQPNGGGP